MARNGRRISQKGANLSRANSSRTVARMSRRGCRLDPVHVTRLEDKDSVEPAASKDS
jgi:hypothetical protein